MYRLYMGSNCERSVQPSLLCLRPWTGKGGVCKGRTLPKGRKQAQVSPITPIAVRESARVATLALRRAVRESARRVRIVHMTIGARL